MVRKWKATFRFRHLLNSGLTTEEVGKGIASLIRNRSTLFGDEGEVFADEFADVSDTDELNMILDHFWDFLDANDIWVPVEVRKEETARAIMSRARDHFTA